MDLSFYIARRYLFSKKSHNAINIISMVSVCGVAIATMALVCALSVLNGFNDLVASMFSYLDPELKIVPAAGKVFDPTLPEIRQVCDMPEVACFSEVLEDNALIRYADRQDFGIVKGVDANYEQLTRIDSVLVDGRFALQEDIVNYATLGIGLAYSLGIRTGYSSPIEIYVPKRDGRINTVNPAASFEVKHVFMGGMFRINQQSYDDHYMIVPLELARSLYRYEKEVTSLELKLVPGTYIPFVKKEMRRQLGDDFLVLDRYDQQADGFRMMQVEKAIIFLILSFILAIALFNIIGSLSMLMMEKQEDVQTLRKLGADETLIKRIFLFEGWMISGFGALIGVLLGLTLCYLQIKFGLLRLGQDGTAFIIDAYPVSVELRDIILVFITVSVIGFFSAWYPVHYLGKKWFPGQNADSAK